MIDFSFLGNIFSGGFIIKVSLLVLIFGYIIFAIVLLNQVRVMNKIVTYESVSSVILLIALANVIAAVALFLYAIAIL